MTPEPTPQGEPGSDRVERWHLVLAEIDQAIALNRIADALSK